VATGGGEPGEVRRAAAMVPVLVLLAIAGLQYSQGAETPSAERWAVAVAWGAIILLAVIFKRQLPGGQALVRAATVPLAVTGLAAVVNLAPRQRAPLLWIAVCAGLVIGLLHRTYLIFINIEPIAIGALVALSAATLLTPMAQDTSRASLVSTTVLAVVVTYFLDTYLEYRDIHRIAPILSVVLMATAIAIGSAVMRARDSRFNQPLLALMVTAGIVGAQLLYFGIDVFTDYRLRFVQGTLLLALVVAVAALVRRHHIGVSQIATAGFIGIAVIQFTIFYADHVGRHGGRISGESEGSERIAFEAVIDHARGQSIPAVYLGWSGALTPLYWRFYAIKHHREDLLPRLIPAGEFNGEQIRRLPDGSVVVAKPSEQVDRQIDRMLAAGELAGRERLLAPDGTEAFWIMRVGAPVRRF
jgi:hypothetical protein